MVCMVSIHNEEQIKGENRRLVCIYKWRKGEEREDV